jgi:hypothetical protein
MEKGLEKKGKYPLLLLEGLQSLIEKGEGKLSYETVE